MAHHNSIILKSISDFIFTTEEEFKDKRKTEGNRGVLSTAQPGAVLTCCRQIFSSSIPVYLTTKLNKERELLGTQNVGADYFHELFFENDRFYQDATRKHSFMYGCGPNSPYRGYNAGANLILTYFLLAHCPTVRRFSPSLIFGRYGYDLSKHTELRTISRGTAEVHTFIRSTVGQYLKTLVFEGVYDDVPLHQSFRKLFTQEYSRHPVPLLENITFTNCDDSLLIALSDGKKRNNRDDDEDDDSGDSASSSSSIFFPAPSLKRITFFYNDGQEPVRTIDAAGSMISVIQTYAEHPTTRNNLQEIVLFHSDIDDAYDVLEPADSMSVIVACAKYLPHCIRTVVVGLDDRFEYERDSQHIECFSKFEVLNKLVINSTRTGLEDDDENNLWSDDENESELILPRTLTELELSFPVIDPKCLQQACKSQESFPYLHSFRHRHTLSNDTQILSDIFSSFATTLKTLQIECCWFDSCANATWNTDRTRYDKLTQVCFDPSRKSSFLCNLENFHLGRCNCYEGRHQGKTGIEAQKVFPLPPSIRRFHFKREIQAESSMLRRILLGDDNDRANGEKAASHHHHQLPQLEEFFTQSDCSNPQAQGCMESIASDLSKISNSLPSLKRISVNVQRRYDSANRVYSFFDCGEVMLKFLDALHLFPAIEALEITGYVKSIFASELQLSGIVINNLEELNQFVKTKAGNLDMKLKHLNLGMYST